MDKNCCIKPFQHASVTQSCASVSVGRGWGGGWGGGKQTQEQLSNLIIAAQVIHMLDDLMSEAAERRSPPLWSC